MLLNFLFLFIFIEKYFTKNIFDYIYDIDEIEILEKEYLCKCNNSGIKGRIVNGTKVEKGDFSWVVAIIYKSTEQISCTGVLINEFSVLTTAHCFRTSQEPSLYNVLAGPIHENINVEFNQNLFREVIKINIHPKYNFDQKLIETDIAILTLDQSFIFGAEFQIYPACFTRKEIALDFKYSYTGTGFGINFSFILNELDSFSQTRNLMQLKLEKTPCNNYDDTYVLCLTSSYSSICLGDSGGPVHIELEKKFIVIGLIESLNTQPRDDKQWVCKSYSTQFFVVIYPNIDWINEKAKYITCEDF